MNRIAGTLFSAALGVLACAATITHAQQKPAPLPDGYPRKSIRVLVGTAVGGGSDVTVRIVAQRLTERWGQSVVVDNRPGASGAIALDVAAQASPDGYTLVVLSVLSVPAMLLKTVNVNIQSAFAPVIRMVSQPYLLVVTPSLPVNSVKDLIAYAKTKPLVYASSGMGSFVHLGMELFKSTTGIDMMHVPYKGSGQSMIDIISGRVHLALTNTISASPHVRSGKLRALAVTSTQRVQAFHDLPTISEAGVPGYELQGWYGLGAPARTPPPLVLALNREIGQVLNTPEMKEKIAAEGAEAAAPHSPAEFKDMIGREISKWEKLLKTPGIKLD